MGLEKRAASVARRFLGPVCPPFVYENRAQSFWHADALDSGPRGAAHKRSDEGVNGKEESAACWSFKDGHGDGCRNNTHKLAALK